MHVAAIQMPVRLDVGANLETLTSALSELRPHTLAVAPEGCLSGYLAQAGMVRLLDSRLTAEAIDAARDIAQSVGLHLFAGACVQIDGRWRNATFYMGPDRQLWRYDKINLAISERGDFVPGDALPVVDLSIDGKSVRVGVQMCREIRYPEQWRYLSSAGAEVIAYVNNAIGNPAGPDLWRTHVISRAAENQRYVVGANNAAPDQGCTSLIVAPTGEVLSEVPAGASAVASAEIDLSQVSNWIIDQARADVVAVQGM